RGADRQPRGVRPDQYGRGEQDHAHGQLGHRHLHRYPPRLRHRAVHVRERSDPATRAGWTPAAQLRRNCGLREHGARSFGETAALGSTERAVLAKLRPRTRAEGAVGVTETHVTVRAESPLWRYGRVLPYVPTCHI